MPMVQEAVEHGADRGRVPQQIAPVLHRATRKVTEVKPNQTWDLDFLSFKHRPYLLHHMLPTRGE